jgi:uncharacterized protein
MISLPLNNLEITIRQNQSLTEILERFGEIALPDSWMVAGCIAQTIWNLCCGQPAEEGIKDIDLIYFDDRDLSPDAEADNERRVGDLFRHLPIRLDVKNEARVHLWYQERFGYRIRPYRSSTDAIASFPTTATAIGVRQTHGEFEYCAPFGLDDLFSLVVRPNKKQITRAIYEAKIERWCSLWPRLTIVPWERTAASASSAACV